ncbi:hypothetical protein LTR17_012123 [Elasticomyces elasticus]|nr:hypothetical protein LTR17_012123 [Elasticomyces elasticus]
MAMLPTGTGIFYQPNSTLSGLPGPADKPSPAESENPRKARKVTRACDRCKAKKLQCSGTNPCETCERKSAACTWDSLHARGQPATPPLSEYSFRRHDTASARPGNDPPLGRYKRFEPEPLGVRSHDVVGLESSRASPDLQTAEVDGHFHDRTSGLTFMHRAWRRISDNQTLPNGLAPDDGMQHVTATGDHPMADSESLEHQHAVSDDPDHLRELVDFYFETCAVTYRFLHTPSVETWLLELSGSAIPQPGSARAAILYTIFAVATFRKEQIRQSATLRKGIEKVGPNLTRSDCYFRMAQKCPTEEPGRLRLESVQARLMQVLYLLQTQRTSQAWYLFGTIVQMTFALGLHRSAERAQAAHGHRSGANYLSIQSRKRTFWAAYTIDTYLCVVLGRPKHYHDDDIDQTFPDSVVDQGNADEAVAEGDEVDSLIDGLIWHARLAQIISATSREVYSVKR